MIDIRNAGKIYGRRPGTVALRDVSLTIARGQVTAVIGPNGAGKSTLFGIVLGFLRPSSGDVSIDELHPQDYMHRHGVGYVSERFALPPGWPVRRAFAALGAMAGLAGDRIDDTLHSFGLHEHQHKTIGALSRGLLQRFGLAQAFAAERDLLVLDEPAEGLDPLWRIQLRDRITQQRDAGRTVLLPPRGTPLLTCNGLLAGARIRSRGVCDAGFAWSAPAVCPRAGSNEVATSNRARNSARMLLVNQVEARRHGLAHFSFVDDVGCLLPFA